MKIINHIRETYGLPQAILARYISVSRGHFSMAAIGRKDLQTPALLKLSKLTLVSENIDRAQIEAAEADHRLLFKKKKDRLMKLKVLETQHRLMGCERKLQRMQVKYQQAIHSLACLAVLQRNQQDPDLPDYKLMERESRELLHKNSGVALLELEFQIAGLEAKLKFLRERESPGEALAAVTAEPQCFEEKISGQLKVTGDGALVTDSNPVAADAAEGIEELEVKTANLQAQPRTTNCGETEPLGRKLEDREPKATSRETVMDATVARPSTPPYNPADVIEKRKKLTENVKGLHLGKNNAVEKPKPELMNTALTAINDFLRSRVRQDLQYRRRRKYA